MKYFVSIENTPYMVWQLRLLWLSMKRLGLQDDLIVACCDLPCFKPQNIDYCNVVHHENVGRRDDDEFATINNKWFGVMAAVSTGALTQPFAIIDADMIMRKPLPVYDEQIVAQWSKNITWSQLASEGYELGELGVTEDMWQPFGFVYCFNNVPSTVFEEVYQSGEYMCCLYRPKEGKLKVGSSYWIRDMVGAAGALSVMAEDFSHKTVNNLQMTLREDHDSRMDDDPDSHFIHYYCGYEPWFVKQTFWPTHKEYKKGLCPYEAILSIPVVNDRVRLIHDITREAQGYEKPLEAYAASGN